MKIARRSAATRPAKPRPTGIVTPCSTSSSMPLAARATSSSPVPSSMRIAAVSVCSASVSAVEQLGEQLLLGQVGERGVGDALQRLQARAGAALLLEQVRVVDRQRGAIGDELEQLAVAGRELARGQAADVEDADRAPPDEQRDAEQRADPLLAQDRVVDVGVVDVGDERSPVDRRRCGRRSRGRPGSSRPARPPPRSPWPRGRAAARRSARAAGSPPCRCAGPP